MYHISNYGFADPNYMEHYGVKGMRWRKRRARYGIDARRYLDKGKDDIAGRMARGGPSGNPGSEYGSYLAGTQKPIRNPQKTDRREYGANRRAQAKSQREKANYAPYPMLIRLVRNGGSKAATNRDLDVMKKGLDNMHYSHNPGINSNQTREDAERYSRPRKPRRR